MKPEHTRPFDFDSAKAGAPYGTATGTAVEIVKWDMHRNGGPILAIIGEHQEVCSYTREGKSASAVALCMLPLAMVEGKPVFVDDELKFTPTGKVAKVAATWSTGTLESGFSLGWEEYEWPKPAKEYPKTRMVMVEASSIYMGTSSLISIASAAIARAIDDGDVFTREQMRKVADAVWLHCRAVCPPDSKERRAIMEGVDPEAIVSETIQATK